MHLHALYRLVWLALLWFEAPPPLQKEKRERVKVKGGTWTMRQRAAGSIGLGDSVYRLLLYRTVEEGRQGMVRKRGTNSLVQEELQKPFLHNIPTIQPPRFYHLLVHIGSYLRSRPCTGWCGS